MIKISNIKMPVEHNEKMLLSAVEKLLGCPCTDLKILKKSIDARKKSDVFYVYTVAACCKDEQKMLQKKNVSEHSEPCMPCIPKISFKKRPVIVGSGPAGLFTAYILAQAGLCPVILERGKTVDKRKKDIDNFYKNRVLNASSNVQFGEGGAGTFSDGKVGTGIKSPYIYHVLKTFVECGAKPEIMYDAHPHIGSDVLPVVIKNLREKIKALGGEFLFENTLRDIKTKNGRIFSAITDTCEFETDHLILATGHSARDTFKMLFSKGISMSAKNFSVGVRIEHLQEDISRACYGDFYNKLPAADYKLSCHLSNGFSVYTFCMCPGGYVSGAASEEGGVVTNGHSLCARDGKNANSALLVGISPNIFGNEPLSGIEYQRKIERAAFVLGGEDYSAPCETVGSFLGKNIGMGKVLPTYSPSVKECSISGVFPSYITESLRLALPVLSKQISGFDNDEAILTAPETRSSSPVRIHRNEMGEASIFGIYPVGEGSGYAGGIMSSAVDGIKTALSIIQNVPRQ